MEERKLWEDEEEGKNGEKWEEKEGEKEDIWTTEYKEK